MVSGQQRKDGGVEMRSSTRTQSQENDEMLSDYP